MQMMLLLLVFAFQLRASQRQATRLRVSRIERSHLWLDRSCLPRYACVARMARSRMRLARYFVSAVAAVTIGVLSLPVSPLTLTAQAVSYTHLRAHETVLD